MIVAVETRFRRKAKLNMTRQFWKKIELVHFRENVENIGIK